MKVLIYGNGWIGNKFLNYMNDSNIECKMSMNRVIKSFIITDILEYKPTNILCCIGRTHDNTVSNIDALENPGMLKININDNLYAPILLAQICKKYNIHMTYIGTGCIYSYDDVIDKFYKYTEDDEPNFFGSQYSIVKGFTDKLMRNFDNVLNCRIRMPISYDISNRNFIIKIINYNKICNKINSMTVLEDFIPIITDMMKKKITSSYNIVNKGYIDHNTILQYYKEKKDNNLKWENITDEELYKLLKAKRSNNILSTKKIKKLYKIPNIKESVYKIIDRM